MVIARKLADMSNDLEFPISISRLPAPSETLTLPISHAANEAAALACDVIAFTNLQASFRFKRWRKHGAIVFCKFSAQVEQECIATLEPVFGRVEDHIERQFLPEHSSDYKMPEIIDGEMILDPEAADLPDIIEGDSINIWDILIEELILVINPFPRADSVEQKTENLEMEPSNPTSEPTHRPFSNLKTLITEKKSNK